MKFCTVIRGPESKIKFVWEKSDNFFPYFDPIVKKLALRPMETSKRYSSVPLKIIARCVYLPPFGVGQSNGVI